MVITLVKNHFKRSKPRLTNINTKNILSLITLFILTVVILSIFGYILYLLTQSFARLRLPDIYLKTVFFILLAVLTLYEVFNIIKQLYQSKDNQIYLKLPVTKEQIFLSKIIYLYTRQLIISLVFLFITAGVYGLVETDITFTYYLRLLLISFILPLLSLVLASLLSIPVSFIQGYLKKNRLLLITSLILVIAVFFIFYIQFINIVLSFIDLTSASSSPVIDPLVIEQLRASTDALRISSIFYNLLMNEKFLINLIQILSVLLVLIVGVFYLLKYFYFRALNKENERIDLEIKKTIKLNSPAKAVFLKEIKTMTRNPDYAFQAVVLNILMPMFIFLTIRLTNSAGEATVGKEIVPGIALLTILIYILLTNSFQGMIISREKEAHFITKIIPIKILKQLFAKIAFGYLLNILMISTTITIITGFGYITLVEGIVVFLLSILFSTAYTVVLIASDYKNPQLTTNVGGFEEGLNMYKNLFMGLFLSIIVGVIFSITPFIRKLFEYRRVFSIFDTFIIMINKHTINYMLYGTILLLIITYLVFSLMQLRKAVKE